AARMPSRERALRTTPPDFLTCSESWASLQRQDGGGDSSAAFPPVAGARTPADSGVRDDVTSPGPRGLRTRLTGVRSGVGPSRRRASEGASHMLSQALIALCLLGQTPQDPNDPSIQFHVGKALAEASVIDLNVDGVGLADRVELSVSDRAKAGGANV